MTEPQNTYSADALEKETTLETILAFLEKDDPAVLFERDESSYTSAKIIRSKLKDCRVSNVELRLSLVCLLRKKISDSNQKAYRRGVTSSTHEHEKEVKALEGKINMKRHKASPKFKASTFAMLYMVLLIMAIIITVVAITFASNEKTSVVIEYNIGEIIGAILAGSGVAIAGIVYALRGTTENEESLIIDEVREE